MPKPSSTVFGTLLLTISLFSLQGTLWYFRPQDSSGTSLHLRHGMGNVRKLLKADSADNQQQDCSLVRHINSSYRCPFVKGQSSCDMSEGFIDYLKFIYCSRFSSKLLPLGYGLLFMWLVLLFITLGLTADDYFCPSLTVICETLGISQNIAGVTFLAFGNGAPDIFSALAAFSQSKNQTGVQLGMQALFGAGIFVTTVVVGVISFISTEIKLTSRPFIRDVLFYLGAMSWTFITLYKENITMTEAIGFIAFYVGYIAVVIIGRYVYQSCKRTAVQVEIQPDPEIESSGQFFETHSIAGTRKQLNASQQSRTALTINTEESDVHRRNKSTPLSNNMVSGALSSSEKTLMAPAFPNAPAHVRQHSTSLDEDLPLLGGKRKVTAWGKFIIGLEPIDREDWSRSNIFKKLFLICKAPAVFFLNLTIPVVDYDEEEHNWNKWLNVLHCVIMPVFCVLATKAGSHLIGCKFPAWALALCFGLLLALVVAMTTKSEKRPRGHSLFAYLAFVISVVWIYTTANEIVNLLKTFGIVFGLSDALLGLTFLAWGNSLGDLISNTAMAKQGFGRMAVSACFGGPLLNMLLGIGISCTYVTVSYGHTIPLRHKYDQYVISAAFLAGSLGSSAICIPLMGFRVPRMYGVYLLTLYLAYLAVSITTAIEHK